ncbi:hypothetical protein F2Q70_00028830 [Brassica cretica]|uniref:DC1 domain-containing protein n=1 Tax=Brassica cretica TaxID=69181 RepID=A0A8S9LC12_BRACR|nr:hypothetical protein F2Q70_00028830 [Brassica cretica]
MASRKPSVRHPSHNHPLRGHKALAEEEIICSGCDLDLIGAAFKCTKSECDYFLHKSCFELPQKGETSSAASEMKSEMDAKMEMAMMQAQLDAIDAAGSYVGSWEPRRRYYW